MSSMRLILICGIAVALLIINLIPFRKGEAIYCPDNSTKYMAQAGLPFGFYATKGSHKDCLTKDEQTSPFSEKPHTYAFNTASLWFDLLINGAVMLGLFFLIDGKRVKV